MNDDATKSKDFVFITLFARLKVRNKRDVN